MLQVSLNRVQLHYNFTCRECSYNKSTCKEFIYKSQPAENVNQRWWQEMVGAGGQEMAAMINDANVNH